RAGSLEQAWAIIAELLAGLGPFLSLTWIPGIAQTLQTTNTELALAFAGILFLQVFEHFQGKDDIAAVFHRLPVVIRWMFYVGLTVAILNLGVAQEIPFIYFQF
ncbi:MAG: hypothetical protein JXR94_10865, partial [Candidatus Hydrogenedentes bacterium]|nr:hypothetical protein [Candidatus Hydrogenedentota bacterium]